MQDEQTAELVKKAQGGDVPAFGELYQLHFEKVYNYCYYRLNCETETAEDLTEEIFLKVFEGLNSYTFQGAQFSTWLLRVAHNHLVDYYRMQGRRPKMVVDPPEFEHTVDPLEEFESKLTREMLSEALSKLTDEQKQVLLLRFVLGKGSAETAYIMNKTEMAVKALQARALRAVKRNMQSEEVVFEG